MTVDFHREYLLRLPLPLAQLYSRAHNAPAARARHDNVFYLFEALIKLAACPLVAAYLREVERGGERVEKLDRLLAQLALPSLGQWTAIVRELGKHFGRRPDAASHPLGHLWKQLDDKRRDQPATLALFRRIKNGADGQPAGDQSCSLLQLFEAMVLYRNGVFGHGAGRFESFFENEMGPLLFPAASEILSEGMLDLLGPAGSRLVYVGELRTVDEDRVEVALSELVGLQSERMAPLELSRSEAAELATNCLAVVWPGRKLPLRLDPLLVFRSSELTDEVLFLNRDRNGRQVEYLSYTTGRTERDTSMAPAMARLLSRITGRDLSEGELEEHRQQSLAETPSVEALFDIAPPAKQVVGDYEILAKLGSGGMGVVYLARQLSLGRLVALKMLPADLSGDEVALARLRREMRALGRCEHPNIVKVLASGTLPDGQLYYAMEYVPGADLEHVWRELSEDGGQVDTSQISGSTWARAIITASRKHREETARRAAGEPTSAGQRDDTTTDRKAGTEAIDTPAAPLAELPLPPLPEPPAEDKDRAGYTRRVARMIRDAALALQAVHDQNVVHRDIKPANLMITPNGSRVVLMDFGLAKGQTQSLTASRAGGFLGTLRYAAPEQLAAAKLKVGPPADVHALGVTLWELLTRRRFFGDAEDENQLSSWVLTRDPPLLRTIDATLDRDLEAIVARSTERDIEHRIQSARDVAEYLDLYLDGKPLPIRLPTMGEMALRWARQRRWPLTGAAAALLVVLAMAVGSFVAIVQSRNETVAVNTELDATNQRLAHINRDLAQAVNATEAARNAAQRSLYVAHMSLAHQALEERDVPRARQLLRQHRPDEDGPDVRGFEWYYLWRGCHEDLILLGDSGVIRSIAWDSPHQRLATSGFDNNVTLWDTRSGDKVAVLEGHTQPVFAVAFSPDGKVLASGGFDARVILWDTQNFQRLKTLLGHAEVMTSLAFSRDGQVLASGGDDDTVRLWHLGTGKSVILGRHKTNVHDLEFAPHANILASTSGDGTARIWNVEELLADPNFPTWDLDEAQLPYRALDHKTSIYPLCWHPSGQFLAVGTNEKKIVIWDLSQLEPLKQGANISQQEQDEKDQLIKPIDQLVGHGQWLQGIVFTSDGRLMLSADEGGGIRVWRRREDVKRLGFEPLSREDGRTMSHAGAIYSIAISSDDALLATGSGDGTVRLWDIAAHELRQRPQPGPPPRSLSGQPNEIMTEIVFSPDHQFMAAGGAGTRRVEGRKVPRGVVQIWDTSNWQQKSLPEAERPGEVYGLAFTRDGNSLVASYGQWDEPGETCIWTRAGDGSWQKAPLPLQHQLTVTSFAFSHDNRLLASCGFDKSVQLWDVSNRSPVKALSQPDKGRAEYHTNWTYGVAFSRDDKWLASASHDRTVRIWNVATGQWEATLDHHAWIYEIAFSPDGRTLAACCWDWTIYLWDTGSWTQRKILKGHTDAVMSVAFAPDSRTLASGSRDGEIKLWNVAMGQEMITLGDRSATLNRVGFSADGRVLAAAAGDGTVKLWIRPTTENRPLN